MRTQVGLGLGAEASGLQQRHPRTALPTLCMAGSTCTGLFVQAGLGWAERPSTEYVRPWRLTLSCRAQALRARALVQHAQSFSAVRLPAMATTFACSAECAALSACTLPALLPGCSTCTDGAMWGQGARSPHAGHTLMHPVRREVEAELVKLIKDGQVAGRIDSHAGVLHARRPDARRDSFRAALAAGVGLGHCRAAQGRCWWRHDLVPALAAGSDLAAARHTGDPACACAGEDYLYNAQASLLRASLAKYDLIQRPVSLGKKGLAFREAQ